jgi:hypothetical protein
LLDDGVTSYAYGNKNIRKSPRDEIVEVKEGKAQEVYRLEELAGKFEALRFTTILRSR